MTGKVKEDEVLTNAAKQFLNKTAFEKSSLITGATREILKEELTKALAEGQSVQQFAKTIRDTYGAMEKPRSLATARTEMTTAVNDGLYSTLKHEGQRQKEWSTVIDGRERESHNQANGQVRNIDEPFQLSGGSGMYPGDPNLPPEENINCFLPGTTIRGRVNMAIKSFYRGKAIEIVTSQGNVLRVTQNHPVLTKQGFVAAGSLQQGDELLSYVGQIHPGGSSRGSLPAHEYDAPTPVEQVFRTLSSSCQSKLLRGMPTDFHGDGKFTEGNIEIVCSDRELLEDLESGSFDQGGDLVFERELSQLLSKNAQSPLAPFGVRVFSPSARSPSSSTLSADGGGVLLDDTPLQEFSFGLSSGFDASLFEDSPNRSARNPELFCNLVDGEPRLIQVDRVVSLRSFEFSDHVYDVQSPNGWIVASNIVTSNCRCSMVVPNLPDDRKRALYGRFLRLHGTLERKLVVSLRAYFADQRRRILSQFPS